MAKPSKQPRSGSSISRPNRSERAVRRALSRQSQSLNRHEETIARHTKIQTWAAIISSAVSALTTAALIYITFQQYIAAKIQAEIADREMRLQYAQAEPAFRVSQSSETILRSSGIISDYRISVPKHLSVKVERGVATIIQVRALQTFSLVYSNGGRQRTCNLSTEDYWIWPAGSSEGKAAGLSSPVFTDGKSNAFAGASPSPLFYMPTQTHLAILFTDVFGARRMTIVAGRDQDWKAVNLSVSEGNAGRELDNINWAEIAHISQSDEMVVGTNYQAVGLSRKKGEIQFYNLYGRSDIGTSCTPIFDMKFLSSTRLF